MQIQKFRVDELKAADYNPRKELKPGDAEFEKLKNSIKEFGYVEPILVNTHNNTILGGHQRLSVLRHLGIEEVECVVVEIADSNKEKALNIALNRISGEWDNDKLTDLLKELKLEGYDTALTGFDIKEIDELFSGTIYDVKEDKFDTEGELAKIDKPTTQQGDIWHLGRHKLLCGDSTAESDVKRLFGDKQVDLVVTDPPYNVDYVSIVEHRHEAGYNQPAHKAIANDKMEDSEFRQLLLGFYKQAYRVLKGGGAFYIFHSAKESLNFIGALQEAGLSYKQTLTWIKNHFVMGRQDYQWITEPVLYGWKEEKGKPHYFIHDRTKITTFEYPDDISKLSKKELQDLLQKYKDEKTTALKFERPMRSHEHPTMKPITLCAEFINNSSRENELVYDAFGGSGSTMMACEQLNRANYSIELDEHYCDIIVARYRKLNPDAEIWLERDGKRQPLKNTKLAISK